MVNPPMVPLVAARFFATRASAFISSVLIFPFSMMVLSSIPIVTFPTRLIFDASMVMVVAVWLMRLTMLFPLKSVELTFELISPGSTLSSERIVVTVPSTVVTFWA